MQKFIVLFLILSSLLSSCERNQDTEKKDSLTMTIFPPVAEKIQKKFSEHGHERTDEYFWLQEKNNPKVIKYLNAENSYATSVMQGTEKLQEILFEELKGRIKEEDSDVPTLNNGYFYTRETKEGKQYAVISRKKKEAGSAPEILIDGNEMAKGKNTFLLGDFEVSSDNQQLVFTSNFTGSYMQYILQSFDLKNQKKGSENIENVDGFALANDNKTIFYVVCNAALRPFRVYKHILGTDPVSDKIVYEEKDELFNIHISKDKTNAYILINSESFTSSETHYLSADKPDAPFKIFNKRKPDVKYIVEPHHQFFFVLYQDNQNKNYKIIQAPLNGFEEENNWKDFIAHDPETKIEALQVFETFLAITKRHKGLTGIKILSLKDKTSKEVSFPEEVFALHTLYNPEYSSTEIRYAYSSLNRPVTVFEYNSKTNTSIKLKEQEIPSGFNPEDYTVKRLFATATDGIKVPIAMVYKNGLRCNGKNPVLLTGYGSYGISYDADFNRNVISLVDKGFVYAIAQIRGGSDLGESWYDDGKLFKKKNTFTDFIACARHLINEKYTSPEYLAIQGGSAGGLLMGAVVNMRPDLFKVVIADVPFVDVINTMLDTSLPLTTQEYEQWGNPAEKQAYEYILSYSPYDNVKPAAYPDILATAGYNDSQVSYHEAAKWIARLRANNTNKNAEILLKTNMDSGHGGASGRFDHLKEVAFRYAFILDRLGMLPRD